MRAYIVKTADGYLYPFDGDLSLTDDKTQAGYFSSIQEANEIVQSLGYRHGDYKVTPIECDDNQADVNSSYFNLH